MGEITRIFDRAQQGDAKAVDELLGMVCHELRGLAAAKNWRIQQRRKW